MLNENNYQRLKNLFCEFNEMIDLDKVTDITGIAGSNLYNVLIEFINKVFANYNLKEDISYLFVSLMYLEKVLVNFTSINRKRLSPKLARIYEKSYRMLEEHSNDLSEENKNVFNNVCKKVNDISISLTNFNGVRYEFLYYLITEHRNLNLIVKLVDDFTISITDKNGDSLFINILKCYLNVLTDVRASENDILYYNSIVRVIVNKNKGKINDKDKAEFLRAVYCFLNNLSIRDRRYKLKKEQCESLIGFFKQEFIDKDIFSSLAVQYGIDIEFDDVIEQAVCNKLKSIYDDEFCNRRIVNDYILSIDNSDAYEIDDCLSCSILPNGNYFLGVHIADVLAYLPYSSYVIQESIKRANTIYLSDKYIPMLPSTLIDNATLIEGELRLANSFYFVISKDGKIINNYIEKTIIKNNSQITYEQANKIIKSEKNNDFKLRETLLNLNAVSDIISEMYSNSDYSLYMKIKESKLNISKNIGSSSSSGKIVNNIMMLTNNMVANYFYNHGYPFIYRIHDINMEKQEEIMSRAREMMNGFSSSDFDRMYEIIKENYPTASYSVAGSHDGLHLEHYTHTTSPLRRGADLVAAEFLNRCYFAMPSKNDIGNMKEELSFVIPLINEGVDRTTMFASDYEIIKRKIRRKVYF